MTSLTLNGGATVVGLRREAEILTVALAQGCHTVLEGPPGTGKSTLLRNIAAASGRGVQFVEGNAELTPARLIGSHDPALVLDGGYTPEAWTDGPLVTAMRSGELLYLEELNRIPEETLNVLITAMAEREIVVPRLGRIAAAEGFVLVAAMNPFDAIGTARVSQSIADRMCRIAIGYLDEQQEREVVQQQTAISGRTVAIAVAIARGSRSHPAVRVGSSVRGAIDMVRLATGLTTVRGEPEAGPDILLDAAITAMSGRVRVHEDQARTAEEVIAQLLDAALASEDRGRATLPPPGEPTQPAQITARDQRPPGPLTGPDARSQIDDAARQTLSRERLDAQHESFATVSPQVGLIDPDAFAGAMRDDPDAAVALLADMAVATDPVLRAQARRLARRLLPPLGRVGTPRRRGTRRLVARSGVGDGDLDIERTIESSSGMRPREASQLVSRQFAAAPRAVCLLVDRSGSMSGHAVAIAAVAAAAIVQAASDRLRCGVIAFAGETIVLRDPRDEAPSERVVEDLLSLRGHGRTDLAGALAAAAGQLEHVPPGGRVAVLLSDCMHTKGADPLGRAGALDGLYVLGTSGKPDSIESGQALARRGHGRWLPATTLDELAVSLQAVLP
ncbi:MAG TPA: MoxR family ATPase [Solirubrobacteraceae bacterium]|nr:MoxR family ATPase [Solirubrobacteraceae bacterium]